MSKIKKIGVFTSGGDAPGMNAAIRAVARSCAFYNLECIGIFRGYQLAGIGRIVFNKECFGMRGYF